MKAAFGPISVHPHKNFIFHTFMLAPSVPSFPSWEEGATIKYVKFQGSYVQGCANVTKIQQPPPNSWCQNSDKKQQL
jgi:hypothetical protein